MKACDSFGMDVCRFMSGKLDLLIAPLEDSPLLPELVGRLNERLEDERRRRERFYDEITPSQKVEFIGGEVIMHSPARNVHLDVTLNISLLLSTYVRRHKIGELKVEKCLCVFSRNDYEPDIVFFSKEKAANFESGTMKFPVPDFVVEVLSESTKERDRGVKFQDYAAQGVGEYWIVDAEQGFVEQYIAEGGEFALQLKASSGEICSAVIEGFTVPIRAFFDSEANLAAVREVMG